MKTVKKSTADKCLDIAADKGVMWDEFVAACHSDYLRVRAQALNDQQGECAYTGLWIGNGTKQIIHIDHFFKKSIYPERQFDWDNLFAAAKNLDYGSDYKDRHIHGPQSNSDAQYRGFYSPLEANLEDMFWYQQDGRVDVHPYVSVEKIAIVENTIKMYNLNAPDLVHKRHGLIRQLRGMKQLDDNSIRLCMQNAGFSFVVEFELQHKC